MARLKGQLAVEFFLILSIVIAFSLTLYNVSLKESGRARTFDAAVTVKSGVDYLSSAGNYVWLSGNQSVLRNSLYVPKSASCFYFNASSKKFFCMLAGDGLQELTGNYSGVVESTEFYGGLVSSSECSGLNPGVYEVTVKNEEQAVNVSCIAR